MKLNFLVSVVIPTYNRREKTLRAIKSVLNQEINNLEVIVVDDGSTDGTSDFLKSKNLPIEIISKENGGVSNARNVGIKNSTGKYIAFLDSDDVWLPGKLNKQIEYFEKNPEVVLVYTDQFLNIDGKNLEQTRFQRNRPNKKMSLPGFVDYTPIHTSTVLIKKEVFDKVGVFSEELSVHEDSELWNRVSDYGDFGYIEEPLSVYYWESEAEHITGAKNKIKSLENGKKYIELYIKNKNRLLTDREKIGVDKSLEIIAEIENGK
jgi:glycosyltransferase involved in cell wall biosynthesis